MTKAAVELYGVAKHFGEVVALKNIDLSITDRKGRSPEARQRRLPATGS